MMLYFYGICGISIWFFLLYYINNINKQIKISRNQISAIHAIGVVFAYVFNINSNLLSIWAISYYITDGILELMVTTKLYNLGMLLHHCVTIGVLTFLQNPETSDIIRMAFLLSEVSNLPMYLVYHLKSVRYNNQIIIKFLIILEALFFIVLRMGFGSKLAYDCYFVHNMPLQICLSSVVILGISFLWTIKLLKQVFNLI